MLPMIALLTTPEKLPTMQQIRAGMHEFVRTLKNYSDEWVMSSDQPDSSKLRFVRYLDAGRYRCLFTMPGQMFVEQGYDGKKLWFVDNLHKTYFDDPGKNLPFLSRQDLDLLTAPAGTFRFNLSGPYDIQMQSVPELRVESMTPDTLGSSKARKVASSALLPKGKVTLELWFEPSRWRLLKAHFSGGESESVTLEMIRSSFAEKPPAGFFTLDETRLAGYTKRNG
jgi:hypothetical protein